MMKTIFKKELSLKCRQGPTRFRRHLFCILKACESRDPVATAVTLTLQGLTRLRQEICFDVSEFIAGSAPPGRSSCAALRFR